MSRTAQRYPSISLFIAISREHHYALEHLTSNWLFNTNTQTPNCTPRKASFQDVLTFSPGPICSLYTSYKSTLFNYPSLWASLVVSPNSIFGVVLAHKSRVPSGTGACWPLKRGPSCGWQHSGKRQKHFRKRQRHSGVDSSPRDVDASFLKGNAGIQM